MFDLFSPTREDLRDVSKTHAINYLAIVDVLIKKGVITEAEYLRSHAKATAAVDQALAQRDAEQREQLEKEHPGLAAMLGKFTDL